MNPQRWYAQHQHLLGSQYEHAFFENVLVKVPGLDFSCLQAQMPFVDDDGKQRYCDFAIQEGTEVRIAIEIDGYDKRGTGAGMTHADFINWQRRQAALTAQGWHVLRYANRDVYNDAERCRNNLRSLLVSLRRKEAANIATQPAMESAPAQKAPNTKKRKRQQVHVKRGLKKAGISIGMAAAVVLGFHFYGQSWLQNQLQAALPTSESVEQTCPNAIHWSKARNHLGETITTVGPITRITYKPEVNGSPTWIEMGASFPDPNRLTLLIWGNDRPKFEEITSGNIPEETACVIGKVSEYRGDVQIQLKESEQLITH